MHVGNTLAQKGMFYFKSEGWKVSVKVHKDNIIRDGKKIM